MSYHPSVSTRLPFVAGYNDHWLCDKYGHQSSGNMHFFYTASSKTISHTYPFLHFDISVYVNYEADNIMFVFDKNLFLNHSNDFQLICMH